MKNDLETIISLLNDELDNFKNIEPTELTTNDLELLKGLVVVRRYFKDLLEDSK